MATCDERAASRTVIEFCTEAGMSPVETIEKMRKTDKYKHVSRALVYKWHGRFSSLIPTSTELNVGGRPKVITGVMVTKVKACIDSDRRQTVRDIAAIVDLSKTSVHRILSDNLNMTRVCARLVHPPYSPDLAPLDFAYFPQLKEQLRGRRFESTEELMRAILSFNRGLPKCWFVNVFDTWVKRHRKCIECRGEYFEKDA